MYPSPTQFNRTGRRVDPSLPRARGFPSAVPFPQTIPFRHLREPLDHDQIRARNDESKDAKADAPKSKETTVLIVGAGAAGIGVAALLSQCGVDNVVIERGRIGESFLSW